MFTYLELEGYYLIFEIKWCVYLISHNSLSSHLCHTMFVAFIRWNQKCVGRWHLHRLCFQKFTIKNIHITKAFIWIPVFPLKIFTSFLSTVRWLIKHVMCPLEKLFRKIYIPCYLCKSYYLIQSSFLVLKGKVLGFL